MLVDFFLEQQIENRRDGKDYAPNRNNFHQHQTTSLCEKLCRYNEQSIESTISDFGTFLDQGRETRIAENDRRFVAGNTTCADQ